MGPYGPIWPHMGPYGPLWAPYGPIWAFMGQKGPCMNRPSVDLPCSSTRNSKILLQIVKHWPAYGPAVQRAVLTPRI